MKTNSSLSPNESERLRELIQELGLPLRRLPEIISRRHEECLAWWSRQNIPITSEAAPFCRLTELTGIPEDQLFTGSYDQTLARRRLMGEHNALPDRYRENCNSFLRTSDHIIRYITLTRGQGFADRVLTSLSVSPLIYKNLNTQINLTFFADLLKTLGNMGFSQEELDTLASVNFLTLHETELGRKFQQSESYYDVYRTLSENFQLFDSNFEYKSQFVGCKYILRTVLPFDQHEFLKKDLQPLALLTRYRHILLAWFPYLAGMTPLFPQAEETRRPGSLEVRYEIDLSMDFKRQRGLRVV